MGTQDEAPQGTAGKSRIIPFANKAIRCSCGADVVKDYWTAIQTYDYTTKYYSWMCRICGQCYKERAKETINL